MILPSTLSEVVTDCGVHVCACVCMCVCVGGGGGIVVQPPRGDPWLLDNGLANSTMW